MNQIRKTGIHILYGGIFSIITCLLAFNGIAMAQPDYTAWEDYGVVYSLPEGDAYYPSVIFDADGFGKGKPFYKMWYSNGAGAVFLTSSIDGFEWGAPQLIQGLTGGAHHAQVLYDPNRFGNPAGLKYKIWYWDLAHPFDTGAIHFAESKDGILWNDLGPILQDDTKPMVTGNSSDWNGGSYGPVFIVYQPVASNVGNDPMQYRYVMYYNATDGSREVTGLAYSADGVNWTAYGDGPVLPGGDSPAWDCSDAVYGTVYQDYSGYHYWYSGGGGDDNAGGCRAGPVSEGIGYAYSADGFNWQRDFLNPIFHIDGSVPHRNQRVYTPSVIRDTEGNLRMYYSAKATSGHKMIGLALLFPAIEVDISIRPRVLLNYFKFRRWNKVRLAIYSSPESEAANQVDQATLTFGKQGYEDSLAYCSAANRDLNRDGFEDLVCFFHRPETDLRCGDNVGIVRGRTKDGYPFSGMDKVRVFPCKRKKR